MPNNATRHQNIVLAAVARVGIQVWSSGPRIASLPSQTEFTDNPDVEHDSRLEYACGLAPFLLRTDHQCWSDPAVGSFRKTVRRVAGERSRLVVACNCTVAGSDEASGRLGENAADTVRQVRRSRDPPSTSSSKILTLTSTLIGAGTASPLRRAVVLAGCSSSPNGVLPFVPVYFSV
jgi:hypothetical protein